MQPCKGIRCSICIYVRTNNVIKTESSEIRLFVNGTCETKVAIYILGCNKCPGTFYVGQIINVWGRTLNHISSIRRNNSDKKILQHFNSEGHCISDFNISILEIPDSNKPRLLDKIERQWISKLDTLK